MEEIVKKPVKAEEAVEKLNTMFKGRASESDNEDKPMLVGDNLETVSKEDEEEAKVTDEEVRLVSELLFKGYAEYTRKFKMFPDFEFVLATTTNEELDIIQNILYMYAVEASKADDEGKDDLTISDIEFNSIKNSIQLALSLKSINGNDICDDPMLKLKTIKSAIRKYNDILIVGDLDAANKLKKELYKAIKTRAVYIRRMPTQLIDVIAEERFKVDVSIYETMNKSGVIPK